MQSLEGHFLHHSELVNPLCENTWVCEDRHESDFAGHIIL